MCFIFITYIEIIFTYVDMNQLGFKIAYMAAYF